MEELILSHLIKNEKYVRRVLPYLNKEMFHDRAEQFLFELVSNHINKYNALPTKETLYIDLSNASGIGEEDFEFCRGFLTNLTIDETTNLEWLVDETEKFFQDRSIQNAIRQSIKILDANTSLTKDAIPGLLQDALAVSFDQKVGHDFLADIQTRFDMYHTHEKRLRFSIDSLNRVTGGGLPNKTLTCFMAPPGVGKSLVMCSLAAGNLMDQKNVLYITLEMAEERIAERIDANLLDVTLKDLKGLSRAEFEKRHAAVQKSTKGRLIIKEYPTAGAGAGHFRHLLNELRIKKKFRPDVIYIDYLNLCTSYRIRGVANVGTYTYVKSIAEELRGLAVEFVVPIITATQANRSSYGSSDIDMENTSDSVGLPMTLDLFLGLIQTDELEQQGLLMIKQLKNRFGDPSFRRKFVVGINKAKMRIFDVEDEDDPDSPLADKLPATQHFDQKTIGSKTFKGFS